MKRKKSSEEMIRSTFADGNAHTAKVRIPGLPYLVLQNLVVEVMEELGLKVQGNGGGASQVNFPTMLKFEQFAQKLGLNTRFCTFEVEGDGQKKKRFGPLSGVTATSQFPFLKMTKSSRRITKMYSPTKGGPLSFIQQEQESVQSFYARKVC